MNYYQTLGVNENAGQDEIKKAYKKLAMKHHPDRGGDNKLFQEISQAYDTLSDPTKRQQYDAERNGFNNPFVNINMGPGFGDLGDIFSFHFGPGFAQPRQSRNRDLTIRVSISFKQSYLGTQIEAKYRTPSGRDKTVVIDVPPGIADGQTIRYPGLGDDSISNAPAGNLNVQLVVEQDPEWIRQGLDLVKIVTIDVFEAILGCSKEINCLDGNKMPLNLRAGIQNGTEFVSNGRGFRDINSGRAGRLIIIVNINIPEIKDQSIIDQIKKIYAEINNIS